MHIKNIQRLDYKGVIYDTENSVSRVHIGLLFLAQAESVEIKETENFSGRWVSENELRNMDISNMETWSQIALKEYKTCR
jgi:predicted NUDIX family phosphoesterase